MTPTQLRQWNQFTGSNLLLAPDILIIKIMEMKSSSNHSSSSSSNVSFHSNYKSEKNRRIQKFLSLLENKKGIPYHASHQLSLNPKEAEAYIDMYNGNIDQAVDAAIHDMVWERLK